MPLFFKEKHLKYQIDQKYCVDIVNVVNDYCSWKQLIKEKWNIYIAVQRQVNHFKRLIGH
jgi:hypothetical protein